VGGAVRRLLGALTLAVLTASCSGSSHRAPPLNTVPTTSASTSTTEAATTSTGVATTALAGPGKCSAAGTRIRLVDSRAAVGHALALFEARNTGSAPCTMSGYPGVEVLDDAGTVLARASNHGGTVVGSAPATLVTVGPRAAAYFGVESESICPGDQPDVPGTRVRVVLPGDTAPLEAAAGVSVCPQPDIVVSPVRRTSSQVAG
jgi:hypothetical protein